MVWVCWLSIGVLFGTKGDRRQGEGKGVNIGGNLTLVLITAIVAITILVSQIVSTVGEYKRAKKLLLSRKDNPSSWGSGSPYTSYTSTTITSDEEEKKKEEGNATSN